MVERSSWATQDAGPTGTVATDGGCRVKDVAVWKSPTTTYKHPVSTVGP